LKELTLVLPWGTSYLRFTLDLLRSSTRPQRFVLEAWGQNQASVGAWWTAIWQLWSPTSSTGD